MFYKTQFCAIFAITTGHGPASVDFNIWKKTSKNA